MTYVSDNPQVGDVLVGEVAPMGRSWTVTKIWKGGDRVTVRTTVVDGKTLDGGPEATRQVCRQRHGTWKLGHSLVRFSRPSIGSAPTEPDAPTFEAVILPEPEHTTPTPVTAALDMVEPLVNAAVKLYRESLDARNEAIDRNVDTRKSQLVALAVQRFAGACDILSAMWQQLGVPAADVEEFRVRKIVQAQHEKLLAVEIAQAKAASTKSLMAAVRTYAQEHYDEGGWDIVVEAYDDRELVELIDRASNEGATTTAEIIKFVGDEVGLVREIQSEREIDRQPIAGWHY